MRLIKKILILFLIIIGVFGGYLGILILLGTLLDYNPKEIEIIQVEDGTEFLIDSTRLTLFNWNIGYAGLGKEMDFFLDGGKTSVVPEEFVTRYLNGITNVLKSYKSDIYLLQEIDRNSKRSAYIDELEFLRNKIFNKYDIAYVDNYKVFFVPVPFFKPMGKVRAGLATVSKFDIKEAKRLKLPGEYGWPTKFFQLDRCIVLTRMDTEWNKELVILNIHPSAYDPGGKLREEQLDFIMKIAKEEYEKGNYVIIGGDWNSEFFENLNFKYTEEKPESYIKLPEFFKLEGWKWAISNNAPTNRSLSAPYKKDETFVTVIDGFYVSPNIDIEYVKNIDLGFEYSDHNPVLLEIVLK